MGVFSRRPYLAAGKAQTPQIAAAAAREEQLRAQAKAQANSLRSMNMMGAAKIGKEGYKLYQGDKLATDQLASEAELENMLADPALENPGMFGGEEILTDAAAPEMGAESVGILDTAAPEVLAEVAPEVLAEAGGEALVGDAALAGGEALVGDAALAAGGEAAATIGAEAATTAAAGSAAGSGIASALAAGAPWALALMAAIKAFG